MSATTATADLITGTGSTDVQAPGRSAETGETRPEAPTAEFQVRLSSGERLTYHEAAELRKDIVEGRIPADSHARFVPDPKARGDAMPAWSSLAQCAVGHPGLRAAYRPVWDTALRFMGYGTLAGIALKLLDSTVTMFAVNETLGVVWLLVLASLAVSSRWPMAPFIAVIFTIKAGIGPGLFLGALVAGLIGVAFGAPLGLVIGTVVGHFRKDDARTAPDAGPEGSRPYVLGLAVPGIYLCIAIPAYVLANIWILEQLTS